MNSPQNGQEEAVFVCSLPDYAQIFMFLRKFGRLLSFPDVTLDELQEFFINRRPEEDNKVVGIHWRLLMSVTRRENRRDWQKMAIRWNLCDKLREYAVRSGLMSQGLLYYYDIPLDKRIQLMKLSCEAQFDCNLPFKAELKKLELVSDKPIGFDRSGRRYWLLQDSSYDVMLFRESDYDVLPPKESSWILLSRSVDQLDGQIMKLAGQHSRGGSDNEREEVVADEDGMEVDGARDKGLGGGNQKGFHRRRSSTSCERMERKKRKGGTKKGAAASSKEREEVGGCLVCGVDNDHQNMLLCDSCDGECHTYCHYPRLWAVPRGTWECPLCDERTLLERLRERHSQLTVCRNQQEKAAEKKQKSIIRLQRTGLLLQNIILNETGTDRSRRSRKAVNYAELNDVYLPPLGPGDFTTSSTSSTETAVGSKSLTEERVVTHCLGTRASRRLQYMSAESGKYQCGARKSGPDDTVERYDDRNNSADSADQFDRTTCRLSDVRVSEGDKEGEEEVSDIDISHASGSYCSENQSTLVAEDGTAIYHVSSQEERYHQDNAVEEERVEEEEEEEEEWEEEKKQLSESERCSTVNESLPLSNNNKDSYRPPSSSSFVVKPVYNGGSTVVNYPDKPIRS